MTYTNSVSVFSWQAQMDTDKTRRSLPRADASKLSLLSPTLSSAGAEERERGARYSKCDKNRVRFLLPLLHANGGEGRGGEVSPSKIRCVCPGSLPSIRVHRCSSVIKNLLKNTLLSAFLTLA